MKKLVLLLAVAFSVSMFSCGKGEKAAATDSDSVKAPETAVVDTPAVADTAATVDTAAVVK